MRVTINWLSEVTGKHAATVRKRTADIPRDSDGKLDSALALEAIYCGSSKPGDEFVSTPEAVRQLTIAKKQQIELDNEITRKERVPISDVLESDNHLHQQIAAIIKTSGIPDASVNEIYEQLRNIPRCQPS